MSSYLTLSLATSTYQPLLTSTTNLSANNVTVAGTLSGTGVTTLLSPYALTTALSSYQLTSGMSSYLTTATASATYQPKFTATLPLSLASNVFSIDLASYLTTTNAASTYQPKLTATLPLSLASNTLSIDLASYLTTATATSTYQPLITSTTDVSARNVTVGGVLSGAGVTTALAPYALTSTSTLSNYYTKTVSDDRYQAKLTSTSDISTGAISAYGASGLSVYNGITKVASIANDGSVNGKTLSVLAGDGSTLTFNAASGLTYSGSDGGTVSQMQAYPTGTTLQYGTKSVTVNATGVTCTPLTINNASTTSKALTINNQACQPVCSINDYGQVNTTGVGIVGSGGLEVGTALAINARITSAGDVTASSLNIPIAPITGSAITIAGNAVLTTTYNPIFCGGFVGPDGVKSTSVGRVNYTSSRSSTGIYTITYDTSYPNNNYMPMITCWTGNTFGTAGTLTNTTRLNVVLYAAGGAATNNYFYFMVF